MDHLTAFTCVDVCSVTADWLWWQYNQVFSIGPNCTSFPDKFNFPLSQALLITFVCPVSYLNKKKFQTNQSSKTASELTCMTYKKYFTKQKKEFNRGGIVEGSLGLEGSQKHNKTVNFGDQRVAKSLAWDSE